MLTFPKSTWFNQPITKETLYQQLKVNTKEKKQIVDEIKTITWMYKLSPDTLNLRPGKSIQEIQVFHVVLKERRISENLLQLLDRNIPYHLVFLVSHQKQGQIILGYKEKIKHHESKHRVDAYFKSPWQELEQLELPINGLTMDQVYENFILHIADNKLMKDPSRELKETVHLSLEKEKLDNKIAALESKAMKEQQPRRKWELAEEIRRLKAERIEKYEC